MSYKVSVLVDTDPMSKPVLVAQGDGTFEAATSMAILVGEDRVILPFREGCGDKNNGVHFFEFDVPLPLEPKVYCVEVRTADGYIIGEEVNITVPPLEPEGSGNQ